MKILTICITQMISISIFALNGNKKTLEIGSAPTKQGFQVVLSVLVNAVATESDNLVGKVLCDKCGRRIKHLSAITESEVVQFLNKEEVLNLKLKTFLKIKIVEFKGIFSNR